MAVATGDEIFARARVAATQMGGDANQSLVIDSLGGLRVLFNNSIRELYRRKANDIKFRHDITVNNTVIIFNGTGTVPATLMREFLHQANISNNDNDLITYFDYAVDANSGETYDQLAYLWIVGDTFHYRGTAPLLAGWNGNIVISCPSFPVFPPSLNDNIPFPSTATIDDLVLLLANAILGKEPFQIVTV